MSGRPQSSNPDTTSELRQLLETMHTCIGAAYGVTVGPGTKTDAIDETMERAVAAQKQRWEAAARIDELEHTLPFGKNSNLYQNRVKELRATLDGVRGEQQV